MVPLCTGLPAGFCRSSCEDAVKWMIAWGPSAQIKQCFPLKSGHFVLDRAGQGNWSEPMSLTSGWLIYSVFLRSRCLVEAAEKCRKQRPVGDAEGWSN